MSEAKGIEWAWSNAPIVLPVSYESREWNAVYVAFYLAEYCGSKLLITHVHDGAERHPFEDEFRKDLEDLARETHVSYEYRLVEPKGIPAGVDEISRGIVDTAEQSGAQAIVMSAHRETLFRELLGRVSDHVARISKSRVVLVETPKQGIKIPKNPKRIFIPVLKETHTDPFIIAAALTSSASVPDVEIVVAKVISLPPTVPLDAVEMNQSFKKEEKDFSFFTSNAIRSLGRLFTPKLFPVREVGEDVHQYVRENGIDVVVMYSGRETGFYGFLTRDEYEIVSRAPCVVLVTLPSAGESPRRARS